MQLSTANRRSYVYLYLSGMIHGSIFEKIAPSLGKEYESLAKALCQIYKDQKEISAENIFLASKNHIAVGQYMEFLNDIDRKKLPDNK